MAVVKGSFEQSNSAVIFGDRLILKIFRRLEPGINPDFEIGRFLSEKTTLRPHPQDRGRPALRTAGSEPLMLGILQGLVRNQGSGWDHALRELKGYYEQVDGRGFPPDLRRVEGRPLLDLADVEVPAEARSAIGRYLDDAAHARPEDRRAAPGPGQRPERPRLRPRADHPDRPGAPGGRDPRAGRDGPRVASRSSLEKLPESIRGQAQLVLDGPPACSEAVDALPGLELDAAKTRVHGDYHLGQVLRTGDDFVILDFEGEPAKPLAERVRKVSPLKDVVGMIRSFDYAAFAALFAFAGDRPEVFDRLAPWAKAWRTWVSARFLGRTGDRREAPRSSRPTGRHVGRMLDALTLDKALYELLYELNNRPDWVRIPLQGVAALVEPADRPIPTPSSLGDIDIYLLGEGTHDRSYEKLGAHPTSHGSGRLPVRRLGTQCPQGLGHRRLQRLEGRRPPDAAREGVGLLGRVRRRASGRGWPTSTRSPRVTAITSVDKADPYAFATEPRPRTASVVADLSAHAWGDCANGWRTARGTTRLGAPISIYEVHLGSWMRGEGNRWLTYRELAPKLADYVHEMGFTHVEFMPVAEHPFDG